MSQIEKKIRIQIFNWDEMDNNHKVLKSHYQFTY